MHDGGKTLYSDPSVWRCVCRASKSLMMCMLALYGWLVGWLLLLSNSGCSRCEMVAIANRKELVFLTIKKNTIGCSVLKQPTTRGTECEPSSLPEASGSGQSRYLTLNYVVMSYRRICRVMHRRVPAEGCPAVPMANSRQKQWAASKLNKLSALMILLLSCAHYVQAGG